MGLGVLLSRSLTASRLSASTPLPLSRPVRHCLPGRAGERARAPPLQHLTSVPRLCVQTPFMRLVRNAEQGTSAQRLLSPLRHSTTSNYVKQARSLAYVALSRRF